MPPGPARFVAFRLTCVTWTAGTRNGGSHERPRSFASVSEGETLTLPEGGSRDRSGSTTCAGPRRRCSHVPVLPWWSRNGSCATRIRGSPRTSIRASTRATCATASTRSGSCPRRGRDAYVMTRLSRRESAVSASCRPAAPPSLQISPLAPAQLARLGYAHHSPRKGSIPYSSNSVANSFRESLSLVRTSSHSS